MGLLRKLFSRKKRVGAGHSVSRFDFTVSSAARHVEIINESLQLASKSKNPEVKISRLQLAKDKLNDLKKLIAPYPEITLPTLGDVARDISRLESEFLTADLKGIADGNMTGEQLEKEGKINEAIELYEELLEKSVDTPFTYRRLAILYRRLKRADDEVRILKIGLRNVPTSNVKHHMWLKDRLSKLTRK